MARKRIDPLTLWEPPLTEPHLRLLVRRALTRKEVEKIEDMQRGSLLDDLMKEGFLEATEDRGLIRTDLGLELIQRWHTAGFLSDVAPSDLSNETPHPLKQRIEAGELEAFLAPELPSLVLQEPEALWWLNGQAKALTCILYGEGKAAKLKTLSPAAYPNVAPVMWETMVRAKRDRVKELIDTFDRAWRGKGTIKIPEERQGVRVAALWTILAQSKEQRSRP